MIEYNIAIPESLRLLIDADPKVRAYVESISYRDPQTGLYNRRYFQESIKKDFGHAARTGEYLSLVMADVDFFKKINDTYGHQTGDCVLRYVASSIKETEKRAGDKACRYGGEEFALILPATDMPGSVSLANGLRENIAKTDVVGWMENCRDHIKKMGESSDDISSALNALSGKGKINVTMSLGVATYPGYDIITDMGLAISADKALYKAKNSGRNCVRAMNGIDID